MPAPKAPATASAASAAPAEAAPLAGTAAPAEAAPLEPRGSVAAQAAQSSAAPVETAAPAAKKAKKEKKEAPASAAAADGGSGEEDNKAAAAGGDEAGGGKKRKRKESLAPAAASAPPVAKGLPPPPPKRSRGGRGRASKPWSAAMAAAYEKQENWRDCAFYYMRDPCDCGTRLSGSFNENTARSAYYNHLCAEHGPHAPGMASDTAWQKVEQTVFVKGQKAKFFPPDGMEPLPDDGESEEGGEDHSWHAAAPAAAPAAPPAPSARPTMRGTATRRPVPALPAAAPAADAAPPVQAVYNLVLPRTEDTAQAFLDRALTILNATARLATTMQCLSAQVSAEATHLQNAYNDLHKAISDARDAQHLQQAPGSSSSSSVARRF